ncbi:hypothetical protein SADUNF_Sadunf08G0070400 [Salix dunnii]|uniref:EF-hand domain-containing protein n=1 Tax=Salix dunnii TaxID=1413687 RepID=A0A835JXB6_9ROSI|nr:hypothetical protein SADUNF_Sadunf08G0070400 [Salix dunnii]
MEKILAGMFGCVLLNILFYLQSLRHLFFASVKPGLNPEKLKQQQGCVQYHHEKEHHEKLNQADIKLVMNRLGLEFHEDGSGGDEGFGADELLSLFEEEEPCSMEEVKEVFDVFDENKDGFIDARELNRVMCRLGLKEGIQIEECSRMIRAVGEDSKEKIDFNDFFRSVGKKFKMGWLGLYVAVVMKLVSAMITG